ncbi:MAG: zinc ribbon domain-containing protein [Planctomycetes bacterium]|nr:zinc ribbon domain-containing protein [Planctomycetota bacterium]
MPDEVPDEAEERVPCPFCAEAILPQAKVCPSCRALLSHGAAKTCENCGSPSGLGAERCRSCGCELPKVDPGRPVRASAPQPPAPSLASPATAGDWIVSLLLPCVGFVVGIVCLAKGQWSRGAVLLCVSTFSSLAWVCIARIVGS